MEWLERGTHGPAGAHGYSAAEAAHTFEAFLEHRLGQQAFWEWLRAFPPHPQGIDPLVEDEIDRALLALRAYHDGQRSWGAVHRELMDARGRLSGLARL
jgi:hypothetical protein